MKKYSGLFTAILIIGFGLTLGACTSAQPNGANGSVSIPNTTIAPPKITRAWFGPVTWDDAAGHYKATLHLIYPPTTGPLRLEGINRWKMGESSGVGVVQPEDISRFANLANTGKHFVKPFTFRYRGERNFTFTLRNPAGTDSIDLPTLRIE